jgi:hypothetical protein
MRRTARISAAYAPRGAGRIGAAPGDERAHRHNRAGTAGGTATITGRSVAIRHQVLTALAARYGGQGPAPIRPLGIGINFAAGDQRRLVLQGRDGR